MKSLIVLCLFLGTSAVFAEEVSSRQKVQVEHVNPDITPGPLDPLEDSGRIEEKIQTLPDLVTQEQFLKSIGFSGDWPTPEEVYKRVEKLEKNDGAAKVRGLANVPLKAQAKMYEEVYRGPWGNPDPHGNAEREPAAVRRQMTSAELHYDTRFTSAERADVKGKASGSSGRSKSQ